MCISYLIHLTPAVAVQYSESFQCHFVSVHEHVLFQSSEGTSCSTRLQIKVAFCDILHAIHSTLVSGSVRVIEHIYTQHCGQRRVQGSTYMQHLVEHADTMSNCMLESGAENCMEGHH